MSSISDVFDTKTDCLNGGSFSPFLFSFRSIKFKAEFRNPSGSSMDRVVAAWIKDNLDQRLLRTNDTIICPFGINRNRSLLQICPHFHLNSLHLIPENCPSRYKEWIELWGGRICSVPSVFKKYDYFREATRLERNHPSYHVLSSYSTYQSLFEERIKENISSSLKTIVTPLGFDNALPGIDFYAKTNPFTDVFGVILEDERKAESVSTSLKGVIRVTKKEAEEMAKKFRKERGFQIGLHSGAVLAATKSVIRNHSCHSEIIRILPDNTENSLIQKALPF